MPNYFTFQAPPDNFSGSIAELMMRGPEAQAQAQLRIGQAQANAAQQSGQAWGGAIQNIGNSIAAIPQQIQQNKLTDLKMQDVQSQIEERKAIAGKNAATNAGLQAVDAVMQKSMKTDPDTGVTSFDRGTFEQGLAQSGQGHLYPQYAEMLDKLDKSASERNTKTRELTAQTLYGIQQSGYTPDSVTMGAAYLKANGIATNSHLGQIFAEIGPDANPETIKPVIEKLAGSLPEYRQIVEAEQGKQAALAKTKAEAAKAAADAAHTTAETAGTIPATPAQQAEIDYKKAQMKEIDAKLNGTAPMTPQQKAELQIQRDRLSAETAHWRNQDQAANPFGTLTAPSGGSGAPSAPGAPPPAGPTTQPQGLRGEDLLKTLPPGVANEVKAYAEGKLPFPTGMSVARLQPLIQLVGQYDPTFDAANYTARAKARTDLTSPNGTGAKTINAMNTALQHAGKLSDLIETLNNSEYPLVNAVTNPLKSASGNTAVTNFNAVAPQLMKEIERSWRGSGGSAGEIQELIKSIGQNQGKQQQREALGQFVDLLKGKLDATTQQRDNALGAAGASIPVLFENNKSVLEKISQRASGSSQTNPFRK